MVSLINGTLLFVFVVFSTCSFVVCIFLFHFSVMMPLSVSPGWILHSFEPLLVDLASLFLSIPPSPSFLMNDSDVFLPDASGKKMCVHSLR